MSAILLLNLPSFAQEIIVSNLDPAQVLGLTLRSKVMHRIVSKSKYSKVPVTQLTAHRASVEILTGEGPFLNIRHGLDCFKHLLSIFNASQFEVYVKTGKFEELTIFAHIKKFTQVFLERVLLTASQLKFLLEDIETDSLTIYNMPNVTEYPREFIFNHRNISIHGFPNIPFSSILSMKSKYFTATLNVTDSTIQDLVDLIKQWVSGGMVHFKELQITYKNLTEVTANSVLREIDQMEGVEMQQMHSSERLIIRPDRKRVFIKLGGSMFHFITN